MTMHGADPLLDWFDRHFSVRLPATRFVRNTLLLSLAGLAPVLAAYISLAPGLWAHLGAGGAGLARFARQILTNGVPVVVVVNAAGFILFAQLRADRLCPVTLLGIDVAMRLGAFIGLHVVIYPASAVMFGAFGDDPAQALRVVGPTLAQAALFANLSGVYLYATLVSAVPLHMGLAGATLRRRGFRRPAAAALIGAALAIFGLQALLLTAAALLLGRLA